MVGFMNGDLHRLSYVLHKPLQCTAAPKGAAFCLGGDSIHDFSEWLNPFLRRCTAQLNYPLVRMG